MSGMNPEVVKKGLDITAYDRLLHRLDFVTGVCFENLKVLIAGNIGSPYPEIAKLTQTVADLNDIFKEFVLLAKVSQQEQGLAAPLNTDATVTETPVTMPNPA